VIAVEVIERIAVEEIKLPLSNTRLSQLNSSQTASGIPENLHCCRINISMLAGKSIDIISKLY